MQKIYLLILVSAGLFLLSQSALLAQEQEPAPFAPAFHDIRLPIPASKTDSSQYVSLADEVARLLNRAIRELRLYDSMFLWLTRSPGFLSEPFGNYGCMTSLSEFKLIRHFVAMMMKTGYRC